MRGLKELNLSLTDWHHAVAREVLILDVEAPWLLPILAVSGLEKITLKMLPPGDLDNGLRLSHRDVAEFEFRIQERLYSRSRLAQGAVNGSIAVGHRC